uniref:Uncharacterized protein n=1 Tax=Pongo abelii TaxID=9601 RepID=A0A8I5TLM9_PONAB
MSDVEENNFKGIVNVHEETEELFPKMLKINQDKRRLMEINESSLSVKISNRNSCSCKIGETVRIS